MQQLLPMLNKTKLKDSLLNSFFTCSSAELITFVHVCIVMIVVRRIRIQLLECEGLVGFGALHLE